MFQLACVQVRSLESQLSAQQDLTHQLQGALRSGQAQTSGNQAQHPAHNASSTRARQLCLPDDEEVTLVWTSSSSHRAASIDSRVSHHADQKVIDSKDGSASSPAGAKQLEMDAEKSRTSTPRRSEAGEQSVAIDGDDERHESDNDTAGHMPEMDSTTAGHRSDPDVSTADHTPESDGAIDGHMDESDTVTAGHTSESDGATDGHRDESDTVTAGHKSESSHVHDAARESELGGPSEIVNPKAGSEGIAPQQTASGATAATTQSSDAAPGGHRPSQTAGKARASGNALLSAAAHNTLAHGEDTTGVQKTKCIESKEAGVDRFERLALSPAGCKQQGASSNGGGHESKSAVTSSNGQAHSFAGGDASDAQITGRHCSRAQLSVGVDSTGQIGVTPGGTHDGHEQFKGGHVTAVAPQRMTSNSAGQAGSDALKERNVDNAAAAMWQTSMEGLGAETCSAACSRGHASLPQSAPKAAMQPPQAQAALEAEQSPQLQLHKVGQSTQLVRKPVKGINCSWLVNSSASTKTVEDSKTVPRRAQSPLDLVLLPAEALIAQARSKMLHTLVSMPDGMAASLGSRWTRTFCHNNRMITNMAPCTQQGRSQASKPGSLRNSTFNAAAGAAQMANTAARACAAMLRTSAVGRTPSNGTVVTWRRGAQVIDLCLAAPKRSNKSGSKQHAIENTKGEEAAALGYAQLWRRQRTAK